MIYLLLSILLGIIFYQLSIPIIFSLVYFMIIYSFKKNKNLLLIIILLFFISFFNTYNRYYEVHNKNININAVVVDKDFNKKKYIVKNNGRKFLMYSQNDYKIGDILNIKAKVISPIGKMNYSDFNYKNYLKSKSIYYILYSKDDYKISQSKIYSLKSLFNERVYNSFRSNLKIRNANLMSAIILSDSNFLDDNLKENFRIAGISHLLALSSLHIGLLMIIFEYLFKTLKLAKIFRRLMSLFIILLYLFLIGFPISATRSFIMFSFIYLGFILKRKIYPVDLLIISSCINLLIWPNSIYSVSFYLSYASVLGIFLFYRRLKSLLGKGFIKSSLALTTSVMIMILPISLYFFNEYSIISIVCNIFITTIMSVAIVLSYFFIIFNPIGLVIAPSINFLLDISINLIGFLNNIFKYNSINLFILEIQLIMYYFAVSIFFIRDLFKNYYKFNLGYFFSLVVIIIFSASIFLYDFNHSLDISFIYVGQGDCSLIKCDGKYFLVDTGGAEHKSLRPGEIYTLKYLKSKGINSLDGVFITHFDKDHVDGILDIVNNVKIKNLYISYYEDNLYLRKLKEKNVNIFLLNKNDKLTINKHADIRILSEPKDYYSPNDKSLVFVLNYKGFKILFTGDIEKAEEYIDCRADILHVPHHGSKTSTSKDFLDRTKPKYAIISCGVNNSYNHPSEEVMENLKSRNIKTFVTSRDGCINLKVNGDRKIFYSELKIDYLFVIITYSIYLIVLIIFMKVYGEYIELQRDL